MGPNWAKKVLGNEISKNYYQIRNQQPRIHTRAKFHLKQSIFNLGAKLGQKKYFWDKTETGQRHPLSFFGL